jgi:hypothetical protein
MVATVESPAIALRPRQYHYSGGKLSVDQKIRIRTLYLTGNLGPKEISDQLKCDYKSTRALISDAGWAKIRGKKWERAEAEITAVVEKDMAEVTQRIAIESEELAMGSLVLLRQSLAPESPDVAALPIEKKLRFMSERAKTAQAASGAARNLVDIARRCRNLDNKPAEQTGNSTNVNLFVFNQPASTKAEKNVTPSTAITGS